MASPQISIPRPTSEERTILLEAQKMSFNRASLGAWVLQCALRQCKTMLDARDKTDRASPK